MSESAERPGAGGSGERAPLRVRVYEEKCIGAGHCVACAPKVFSQREEDGVVVLLDANPVESEREGVTAAVRMCPTSAIEASEEHDPA